MNASPLPEQRLSWFGRLCHWGLNERYSDEERRLVLIANVIALALALVTYPYAPLFAAIGAPMLGLAVLPIASSHFSILWLNRAGHSRYARWQIVTVFNAAIFVYASSFGAGSGIHLLYFVTICLPLVTASLNDRVFIAYGLLLPVALFLLLELTDFSVLPSVGIDSGVQRIIYYALVPTTFILLNIAVVYLWLSNRRAEAQLTSTLQRLWGEMDLAHKIQTVLLPKQPVAQGYNISTRMTLAAEVGGDYYDVINAGNQDWLVIGDVSGHGVDSGLVMMMVQTALQTTIHVLQASSPVPPEPSRVLSLVNTAVRHNLRSMGSKKYMTLTVLLLDGGSVRYAGLHQDLLIYRAASHDVETIPTHGVWLGVADDISADTIDETLDLNPGDKLLLYTDGITESRKNGHLLEVSGLRRMFSALADKSNATDIAEGIINGLSDYEKRDDFTLMVVERRAEGQRAS